MGSSLRCAQFVRAQHGDHYFQVTLSIYTPHTGFIVAVVTVTTRSVTQSSENIEMTSIRFHAPWGVQFSRLGCCLSSIFATGILVT